MASRFDDFEKPAKQCPLPTPEDIDKQTAEQPKKKAGCIKPKPPCKPSNFLKPFKPKKPFEDYNAEGELVGYWWGYGDTIDLEFCLSGYVLDDIENTYMTVREFVKDKNINFTLYNFRHEEIITKTYKGADYQEPTYSEVDWVTPLTKGVFYIYTPVEPSGGTYTQVILPEQYQEDTTYYIQDDVKVVFSIDAELALKLVRGVYFCSLTITSTNNDFAYTVYYQENSTFTIR